MENNVNKQFEKNAFGRILKASKENDRVIVGIVSRELLDMDNEVILIDGIDLSVYNNNPQFFLNHETNIGRGLWIKKGEDSISKYLMASFQFDTDELAEKFYQKAKNGMVTKFSISGMIMEERKPSKLDKKRYGSEASRVLSKVRLLEVSLVEIPANHHTEMLSVKGFAKDIDIETIKKDIDVDFIEEVKKEEDLSNSSKEEVNEEQEVLPVSTNEEDEEEVSIEDTLSQLTVDQKKALIDILSREIENEETEEPEEQEETPVEPVEQEEQEDESITILIPDKSKKLSREEKALKRNGKIFIS